MTSCTCLWVDGRRVDGTHCPVHDTLTGVPAEPAEDQARRAVVAEMHRQHATVMEGHCPRCHRQLAAGTCAPCGLGYSASAGPDGWQLTTRLLDA